MNRQEVAALSIGLLLIFGVTGIAHVSDRVSITERPYESNGEGSSQGDDGWNVTIPVVQAMEAAEEATGGTAIEVRLGQERNTSSAERPAQAYQVNVLRPNNSSVVVDVSAENGTVLGVGHMENQTVGWRSLFGAETGNSTSVQRLNLSTIRSGPEAVRLAREETGTNRTVTQVQFRSQNGTSVYSIQVVTTTGDRSTVVVAADPDEGDILSNKTENQSSTE